MKLFLKNLFYSLPIQLFILHFRKYQILLIFWYMLFAVVQGSFMKSFGADALFFSPEYLGSVNMLAAFITGLSLGVFIMCWNITTFILHSKRLKFLATTSGPFLKYCINNGLLPLSFIGFYFVKLYQFNQYKELMSGGLVFLEILSISFGVFILVSFSFAYFFGASKTIERTMAPLVGNPEVFNKTFVVKDNKQDEFGLKVLWYLSKGFKLKKVRNVNHYRQDFLDTIFKRHHWAAIISIVIAFILLVVTGFMQEHKIFEIPAACSILIFFALLIAVIGALTYFLQSWSLLAVIVLVFILNILYQKDIIDPRNKAYGLNYTNKTERPNYDKQSLQQLCADSNITADKANMIAILNNWKKKQTTEKPLMVFINVSGGGLRSAVFTMNALQHTDSLCGGKLMKKTILISGASGGMLAASYYRELFAARNSYARYNLYDKKYTNNISKDLLNPVFTSLMARDLFAPGQRFTLGENSYVKDRGYAFEKKLSENTNGVLDKQLKNLKTLEHNADIPLMIFNAVIKADARKLMISPQPISFMMKPVALQGDTTTSPDAVDFAALFAKQNPMDLRLLTAMRMNATFPYVLPNVWLPSNPVIDVMDAGLRDNFGQETTLRFIDNFKDWIKENTSGVLIIQIRDRPADNWQQPFESSSITDMIVTPATMMQHNWFKMQGYYYDDELAYFKNDTALKINKVTLAYVAEKEEKTAALNFHLSAREKRDVIASFDNKANQTEAKKIVELLKR
jgi:Patatin-like phospholipase